MHDYVGLQQARQGIEREQARVARARSGKPDMSGAEDWSVLA
jgi:hypothetical protein